MKTVVLMLFAAFVGAGIASADPVRDWPDLRAAHEQIEHALESLHRAQAANQYDMGGHAGRAEQLLQQAEHELHEAIESRHRD